MLPETPGAPSQRLSQGLRGGWRGPWDGGWGDGSPGTASRWDVGMKFPALRRTGGWEGIPREGAVAAPGSLEHPGTTRSRPRDRPGGLFHPKPLRNPGNSWISSCPTPRDPPELPQPLPEIPHLPPPPPRRRIPKAPGLGWTLGYPKRCWSLGQTGTDWDRLGSGGCREIPGGSSPQNPKRRNKSLNQLPAPRDCGSRTAKAPNSALFQPFPGTLQARDGWEWTGSIPCSSSPRWDRNLRPWARNSPGKTARGRFSGTFSGCRESYELKTLSAELRRRRRASAPCLRREPGKKTRI